MTDSLQEKIEAWPKEQLASHLEGIASHLKTSNQPLMPTQMNVLALERAANLLRGK